MVILILLFRLRYVTGDICNINAEILCLPEKWGEFSQQGEERPSRLFAVPLITPSSSSLSQVALLLLLIHWRDTTTTTEAQQSGNSE